MQTALALLHADMALDTAPEMASGLPLAERLTARLCHDMAGLVATLSGTLEMVLEDQCSDTEAVGLAVEAAGTLAVRLRLYRAAWGGGDLEQATLAKLAEGLPNRPRLSVDLTALDEARAQGALDEDGARLALCLLITASSGLPRGGSIDASVALSGLAMKIAGRNASWPTGLAADMAQMRAASMQWTLTTQGDEMIATPLP